MYKKIVFFALIFLALTGFAQEVVTVNYDDQGSSKSFEAVLTKPQSLSNGRAVVILHHSGGWGVGTTKQYAEFLSASGFTTLEPRMFNVRTDRFSPFIPQVFASLGFLASLDGVDKDQISVMGLSFGGMLSVFVASEMVNEKFNKTGYVFAKYAPFYPSCWLHAAVMNRKLPWLLSMGFKFDPAVLDKFVGKPMRLYSGDSDDYDDRDPEICNAMVQSMKDEKQKVKTEVVVFKDATHGWDQGLENFNEPLLGCKGKGCRIQITPNPIATTSALSDLKEFLLR
jgi:dienelactone hydrolase